MTEMPNLEISHEEEITAENIQKSLTDVKIKTEDDEDLTREVFYFNASNEAQTYVRDSQNFDIMASNSQPEENMEHLMMMDQENEQDEQEDSKMTVDLGHLIKMHMPEMKDEEGQPALHYIKYKPDGNGKNIKVWECGICHKEFGHQYILMRHLPTHTDERKYQCKQCGKAFRQMSTLSQHRAIHSKLRPYVCEVCKKTFNRVSTLISHRKTHTGMKPHRCHLCNKAFHQKGNLRNHIFTHTNERPYKCDVCNKGFNQMSNLMCHKFKAHQRADKPKYHCQTCGKLFDRRIGLRNHEQYEHGESNMASSMGAPSMVQPGMASSSGNLTLNGNGDDMVGTPNVKYTNGVMVPLINTNAMKQIIAAGKIPFALLKPIDDVPVLVRIFHAHPKHMLVPATVEDIKKYCKLTPKLEPISFDNDDKDHILNENNNRDVLLINVPVVATIIQRKVNGVVRMDILDPGPEVQNRADSAGESSEDYEEEIDENEGESSPDEKDYTQILDYDDDAAVRYDTNMYDAAASLMDLRARPQHIDVDQNSVEIFNHDEVDIDITNSVIDLEKDHKAYGIIAECGYNLTGEGNRTEGCGTFEDTEHVEIDRISQDGSAGEGKESDDDGIEIALSL